MPDDAAPRTARADAARIARHDGRAPRYTSYPTALQFGPAVDEAAYRGWLAALPREEGVSLYLHVPFCARLCWYCGCHTRAVRRQAPVAGYVGHLLREIALVGAALPGRLAADSVHFGGGTPNMLAPEELATLLGALSRSFAIAPEAEIAAELDPASLRRDWVAAAGRLGLSRASLGVQSLDPRVLAAVNRRQSPAEIADCVAALRAAGIRSLNLDLMYGLPFQTTASLLETVAGVLAFRPERLALFGYAHVPWMKRHQRLIEAAALPGAAERLDQSEAAAERLAAAGYVRIGLDHFALPGDALAEAAAAGRLRRNFQGYTDDAARTLIGLGVSAIGTLPQGHVQNGARETGWRAALDRGALPVARGVALTAEDRFRGEIIERLMCDLAVDLAAACRRHGRRLEALAPALARLEAFRADGLATLEGGRLAVTAAGRPFLRPVAACFDAYREAQAERHARAI